MRKCIKVLLSVTLVSAILTGCGTKPSNEENDSNTSPKVEESQTEEDNNLEIAYTEESITIKNGDYDIPAIITLPTGIEDRNVPLVIMCHGTASNKDEAGDGYKMYASKLAEAGIASIRFDFIGTGDSKVDYSKYNFTTALNDVSKVIEYAKELKSIDSENIGILGWSQGGSIAMLAAGEIPDIKSVVTWAGAENDCLLTLGDYEAAKANGYAIVEFDWRDSLNFGLQWHEDVRNIDILETLKKSKAPVLALNGSNDDVVPPETTDLIIETSTNELSKKSIIDGADHTFNISTGDLTKYNELCTQTTQWFLDTLK